MTCTTSQPGTPRPHSATPADSPPHSTRHEVITAATYGRPVNGDIECPLVPYGTASTWSLRYNAIRDACVENMHRWRPAMAKVLGTVKKDILFGTSANDQIFGLDDADTLVASDGNDTLDGGTGTDTVSYAAMAGPVSLVLGDGISDGLAQKFSLTTATLIDGSTVTISLLTSTDTLRSIENVVGTPEIDTNAARRGGIVDRVGA